MNPIKLIANIIEFFRSEYNNWKIKTFSLGCSVAEAKLIDGEKIRVTRKGRYSGYQDFHSVSDSEIHIAFNQKYIKGDDGITYSTSKIVSYKIIEKYEYFETYVWGEETSSTLFGDRNLISEE